MAKPVHEDLLNNERIHAVSDDDLRNGEFILVADANAWETEHLTPRAALITLIYKNSACPSLWIPISVLGFSPSGDLYVKGWFYDKNFKRYN